MVAEEVKWNEPAYMIFMQQKTVIASKFLKLGYTVLFSDVDVVFLSPHIITYMDETFGNAQMLFMVNGAFKYYGLSAGFYVARPTPAILDLFEKAIEMQVSSQEKIYLVHFIPWQGILAKIWSLRLNFRSNISKNYKI